MATGFGVDPVEAVQVSLRLAGIKVEMRAARDAVPEPPATNSEMIDAALADFATATRRAHDDLDANLDSTSDLLGSLAIGESDLDKKLANLLGML